MSDSNHDSILLMLVADKFAEGQVEVAEAAIRLALSDGISLVAIYETLCDVAYNSHAPRFGLEDGLSSYLLDQELVALANRLQSAEAVPQFPTVLVVSKYRQGIAACLCHLMREQDIGVYTISSPVVPVRSLHRELQGGGYFSHVTHVVADLDGIEAGTLVEDITELQALLRPFDHILSTVLLDPDSDGKAIEPEMDPAGGLTIVRSFAAAIMSTGVPTINLLSSRELDVLRLVAAGETNGQIAQITGLSVGSVKTYLQRAQAKTGGRDRASTIAIAIQRGWLN